MSYPEEICWTWFDILIYASTTQKIICSFELLFLVVFWPSSINWWSRACHALMLIDAYYFLWSVGPFYSRMTRRNKLQYLIHIQDWVKVVVFRKSNAKPAFALFYLGVLFYLCQEYHRNCTISYELLMQWYFSPSSFIPRSSCCCNRNVDKWFVMCEINTPSNLVAW